MKSVRILALAAFLVFSTAVALADSIPPGDPVIRTGGGTGSVPIYWPTFTILTATGNSPTDGTPCMLTKEDNPTPAPGCFFLNDIQTEGNTIHKLIFVAETDFSGPLTCALSTAQGGQSPWFTECIATGRAVEFFGGPGIPFGGTFRSGSGASTLMLLSASSPLQKAMTLPRPFQSRGRWPSWVASLRCWCVGGCTLAN